MLAFFYIYIGQFSCSLCNVNFKFQSKLDRHLASADHQTFQKIMVEDADIQEDSLCVGSAFAEVDLEGSVGDMSDDTIGDFEQNSNEDGMFALPWHLCSQGTNYA